MRNKTFMVLHSSNPNNFDDDFSSIPKNPELKNLINSSDLVASNDLVASSDNTSTFDGKLDASADSQNFKIKEKEKENLNVSKESKFSKFVSRKGKILTEQSSFLVLGLGITAVVGVLLSQLFFKRRLY